MALPNKNDTQHSRSRVRLWYAALLIIIGVFGVRLFYVQVIDYGHYKLAALGDQLKQYQIPAKRGLIEAHVGDSIQPLVLNQQLFTLYADPVYVKNPDELGRKVADVVGGSPDSYTKLLRTPHTRYVILGKKLSPEQSDKVLALKQPGLGTQAQDFRIYPDGSLASQLLGFVNGDGNGEYGLEQALNKQLSGSPGQVKAVTDVNGVPLAANRGNIDTPPVDGKDVVTTLNMTMQAQLETILQQEYDKTKSKGLSVVVMDPTNGQVKAMANYPTYDPSHYASVSNPSLFQNAAVTNPIEPGSTMKALTTAAAIDQGVIQANTTFYDPAHWLVDGFNITDIEEDGGARVQSIASILNLSLNTGATWELMQMGGGQINTKARQAWYDYMTNHFMFGKATGIEQGYEAVVKVPRPEDNGAGINLTYANTSFGQGVQVTAVQMAAAISSIVNGGTYYQPQLVDRLNTADGHSTVIAAKALKHNVVSAKTSQAILPLMENVVQQHLQSGFGYLNFGSDYIVGGKTGTAQIAQPGGGYYANKFNGTYVGFVGGDKPQYVVVVYNLQPDVAGYAGANGGQPVFADAVHMLINNSFVTPKTH